MNAYSQINRSRRMTQANGAASCGCSGRGTARPSLSTELPGAREHYRGEPAPIWFAALMASDCRAQNNQSGHEVLWSCVSGRALYTNCGSEAEFIQPLGVRLQSGQTVAVSWRPGESDYTVEVYAEAGYSYCA